MVSTESITGHQHRLRVRNYDLGATLDSGQAFRWKPRHTAWTGVIGHHWVRLTQMGDGILAEVSADPGDWRWLEEYLQSDLDLEAVLNQLPGDPPLREAVRHHHGLRLLRQDPWECLASFILSSTKQIRHIKQIVETLCNRHGAPVATPPGISTAYAFPAAARIASLNEPELRSLGMGFRAPYLLEVARRVSSGHLNLAQLKRRPLPEARAALMNLPGVGRKIADCVLLFALGFDEAFPVDVWVMRTLQSAWFPHRKMLLRELVSFSEQHFGRYGGYAQQYLFHHARTGAPTAVRSPHHDHSD